VLWGTRHLVVEVAPTVVVGCIVVVAGSDDGTPAAVVGGGIATMLPAGPAGPAGPCAPGGPGAGGALGPVELGSVDDGGRLVVGGWVVTGGSVVGPGSSRLAVVMIVAAANDPASRAAPTHHSRAVCRACRARTIPIRRLTLMRTATVHQ